MEKLENTLLISLTPPQKKILDLIKTYLKTEGYAPTVREIAEELGYKSPRAVSYHLEKLEKKGLIKKTSDGSRNIAIKNIKDKKESFFAPLVGWSAGGKPLYAEENIIDWITIPSEFIKEEADVFLLRVKGNSMAPKIEHNDIVIVKKQLVAQPGNIVLALIGNETTIKKYIPRQGQIVLQPINPAFEPIIVKPNRLKIQGVVKGVLKKIA